MMLAPFVAAKPGALDGPSEVGKGVHGAAEGGARHLGVPWLGLARWARRKHEGVDDDIDAVRECRLHSGPVVVAKRTHHPYRRIGRRQLVGQLLAHASSTAAAAARLRRRTE